MSTPTGKVNLTHDETSHFVELSFNAPGETSEEHDQMALETREFYNDLKNRFPDSKFRILVDLSNAGIPTKHATDMYTETLSDKRIEKTAIFGMSKAIESIINFIVSASGRGEKVRFFIDRDQAKAWLDQNQ